MKFKNLVSGKEVADFKGGDILILKDRRTGEEVVYVITGQYNRYNLTNLHDGITFTERFKPLEDILTRTRKWYDLIGVIGNEHLEWVTSKENVNHAYEMGLNPCMRDINIEKIIELSNKGYYTNQIAKKLNCDRKMISRRAKRYGIIIRDGRKNRGEIYG